MKLTIEIPDTGRTVASQELQEITAALIPALETAFLLQPQYKPKPWTKGKVRVTLLDHGNVWEGNW